MNIPFAKQPWSQITDQLAVGGHRYIGPDGALHNVVVHAEFDLVLSFHQQYGCGPDQGTERYYAIIPDSRLTPAQLGSVRDFADTGAAAIRRGWTVLARCHAGYNRSALLAAFILLRLGHAPDEAITLIRERRSKHALSNPAFVDYIYAESSTPRPAPRVIV